MIHFQTRDRVSPSKQVAFQLIECPSLYSISVYPIQEVDYICVHAPYQECLPTTPTLRYQLRR